MQTKKCTTCRKRKILNEFYRSKYGKYGHRSKCKQCEGKTVREWQQANQKRCRDNNKNWQRLNKEHCRLKGWKSHLKRKFGLTLEQYDAMFKDQGGRCAICGEPETQAYKGRIRNLNVDHDHKTGNICKLLCTNCNQGLGKFRDNPKTMEKAATYVRQYRKNP